MLIDELRSRVRQAMKDRDTVAKEVLCVALGDLETAQARSGQPASDAEVEAVLRKLVKSNDETRQITADEAQKATLARENDVLRDLLPKTLDVEAIVAALAGVAGDITAAGNDGQATGVAMKHLKTSGATVLGKDVSEAVRRMRASA